MNDLEHVDEFLYLYCWCGHQARSQDTAAVFRCRPETAGVTVRHRDGAAFSTLLCLGIYQNKGENCTVPADMLYTIIGLLPTAECGPMLTAKGEEWRLLQPTVLSLFSPPPAPPRPMCPAPPAATRGMGAHSEAESATRSERILRRDKGKRPEKLT